MKFSKKGKVAGGGGNFKEVDWPAFNDHLFEKISEATEDGGCPNQVCFISGIVDTGTQPPNEEYTVYDKEEEGSEDQEKQQKLIDKDFGCYYDGDKFYIPNKWADSVLFFVDFPDIMIDYGKFWNDDGESELKPYRTLLAGEWDGVAQITTLVPSSSGYGAKSRIAKLAKATGCTKGLPKADFDIGDLMGKPFTMDIEVEKNGDKGQYVNVRAKNVGSKHKSIPFPEHDIEPFGITMNGENDKEDIKFIMKKAVLNRLEMAKEWEDSDLKAQIEEYKVEKGYSSGSDQEEKREEEEINLPDEPEESQEEDGGEEKVKF